MNRESEAMLNAQHQLCPVCRKVEFKMSYLNMLNDKILFPDGTLRPGITLPQLIDREIATHQPHGAPND